MLSLAATRNTLAMTVWPVAGDSRAAARAVRNVVLAVMGSLLIWASAKIYVPLYPVPITMQTFAVLAVGMAYGWRLGAASVLFYLAEGAAGLPVFAGTAEPGLAILTGSTGGYLFGFILAAAACGWLAERGWDRNIVTTALAMYIGNVLIYIPGLLWLGNVLGWENPILAWGLTPFILGDVMKLALAAAVLPLAWRFVSPRRKT